MLVRRRPVKARIRMALSFLSAIAAVLCLISLLMGFYLYFSVPMNMEIPLEPLESEHPYPVGWEERLVLRPSFSYASLRIRKLILEEGDVFFVQDMTTGERYTIDYNCTYKAIGLFRVNATGYLNILVGISDDGDGETSWGVIIDMVITDIWTLNLFVTAPIPGVPLPYFSVPAWALALALQLVFATCLILAFVEAGGFHKAISESPDKPLARCMRNFLYAMPFVATGTLVGIIALTVLIEAAGVPAEPTWVWPGPILLMLEGSYAALVEELVFRLLFVGGILFIVAISRLGRGTEGSGADALKALFFPGWLEGDMKRAVRKAGWVLVLLSSLAFGLAHFLGGGWEVGKAITATIDGLVLGACFLLYGIHASLLLHWFRNYYLSSWEALAYATGSDVALLAHLLVILFNVVLGVLSLIMFLVQGIRLVMRRRAREEPAAWPYG